MEKSNVLILMLKWNCCMCNDELSFTQILRDEGRVELFEVVAAHSSF